MVKKTGIGFDPIKEVLVKSGKEILRKKGEELLEEKGSKIETLLQEIESTKSEAKKNLPVYGLFAMGGLFILLGLAKHLSTILGTSEANGLLIIGAILLLMGFIYRAGTKG